MKFKKFIIKRDENNNVIVENQGASSANDDAQINNELPVDTNNSNNANNFNTEFHKTDTPNDEIRDNRFSTRDNINRKIRRYKLGKLKKYVIFIAILAIVMGGFYLYFEYKSYTNYSVLSETDRSDTEATKFVEFADGIVKYSNDGVSYTSLDDELIWNQAFDMENPNYEVSGKYIAIGDVSGKTIYVMNTSGVQYYIELNDFILDFSVSSNGAVAVLTQSDDSYGLELYAKDGTVAASGELYSTNSGYPLNIALSDNAKLLAVSSMVIDGYTVDSTITFYNFGSVGQNEQDNIVGTYSYDDLLVADMYFMEDGKMLAFGNDCVQIYSGSQKPALQNTLEVEDEIKSVFYSDEYFGLVFNNGDEDNSRRIEIYDDKCKNILTKDVVMDYETIEFLSDNEICIRNEYQCQLYSLNGTKRLDVTFDVSLYRIVPEKFGIYYTVVLQGKTERIRLV